MFFPSPDSWSYVEYLGVFKLEQIRQEKLVWDARCMRGPMIEADIDWRVPHPYRKAVAGDIT